MFRPQRMTTFEVCVTFNEPPKITKLPLTEYNVFGRASGDIVLSLSVNDDFGYGDTEWSIAGQNHAWLLFYELLINLAPYHLPLSICYLKKTACLSGKIVHLRTKRLFRINDCVKEHLTVSKANILELYREKSFCLQQDMDPLPTLLYRNTLYDMLLLMLVPSLDQLLDISSTSFLLTFIKITSLGLVWKYKSRTPS